MTTNEAGTGAGADAQAAGAAAVSRTQSPPTSPGTVKGPDPQQPSARQPRGGRLLATLALLCALAALAGVGYLYWQWAYEPDPLAARLADLEQRFAARPPIQPSAVDAEAIGREVQRATAELRRSLAAELRAATGPAAPGGAPGAAGQAAPAPRDWQLAEVRYLLRMANHRLLLERDAPGAAALLEAADEVLVELDDFALHEVRARIAAERLALESLPVLDAEGLFLQLEAIKGDLDQLPLRVPELEPVQPATAPATWWEAVRAEIDNLVRFRRFDGAAVRPLLAPEEAVYLELNLRLMLERAQLAGLRREQAIYDQSIAVARDWIERYLDDSTPEVRRIQEGLRALATVRLAAPLPDLSGSLAALNALRELDAPRAEPGPAP